MPLSTNGVLLIIQFFFLSCYLFQSVLAAWQAIKREHVNVRFPSWPSDRVWWPIEKALIDISFMPRGRRRDVAHDRLERDTIAAEVNYSLVDGGDVMIAPFFYAALAA